VPILVTVSGMETDVSSVQPEKAPLQIPITV
jgi:hypothetical protein